MGVKIIPVFRSQFCTLFLDTIFWGCCIASWMQRIVCIRFEHTVNIQSPYSHHTIIIQSSYSQHVAKSHESLCLVHNLLVRGAPIRRSSCHDFLTRLGLVSHSTWGCVFFANNAPCKGHVRQCVSEHRWLQHGAFHEVLWINR